MVRARCVVGWGGRLTRTWLFFVGIVVFFGIRRVNTPPSVSIPSDSGVTSSSSRPPTSPFSTPPWIAAPIATTSSGFTPLYGSRPNVFFTSSCTIGIRDIPPTRITSWISDAFSPESFRHTSHGFTVRFTSPSTSPSSFDRVSVSCRWSGPLSFADTYGRFTSVCIADDSSIFAFSAASRTRCSAILSFARSTPSDFLKFSTSEFVIATSKSSPPRNVSPFVAFTSNTPPDTSRIDTSNVPPPRSYTAITLSSSLSSPYASAAAVGSLMIRTMFSFEIAPASFVACLCASLKYAGTVTTAFGTVAPRCASAVSRIFSSTNDPIWLGEYSLPAESATHAAPPDPRTILNGTCFWSSCVSLSVKLRPIRRLIP